MYKILGAFVSRVGGVDLSNCSMLSDVEMVLQNYYLVTEDLKIRLSRP